MIRREVDRKPINNNCRNQRRGLSQGAKWANDIHGMVNGEKLEGVKYESKVLNIMIETDDRINNTKLIIFSRSIEPRKKSENIFGATEYVIKKLFGHIDYQYALKYCKNTMRYYSSAQIRTFRNGSGMWRD